MKNKIIPATKIKTNFNPQPSDITVTVKTHKCNTSQHTSKQPCPTKLQEQLNSLEDYVDELAEYITNIRKDINEIKKLLDEKK